MAWKGLLRDFLQGNEVPVFCKQPCMRFLAVDYTPQQEEAHPITLEDFLSCCK